MGEKYSPAVSFTIENSPWKWFGKLWEWSTQQGWFYDFGGYLYDKEDTIDDYTINILEYFINPDKFADAIYDFLKSNTIQSKDFFPLKNELTGKNIEKIILES
ncbi:MAG: hypothetical protein Q8K02_18255 [Flavobacterium sp.]|nr:hypothetical protein [Flavobacterium sp.]